MRSFRMGIVGSRTYPNITEVWERLTFDQRATNILIAREIISNFIDQLPATATVVSGGAKGVDTYAVEIAKDRKLETQVFLPDWKKYGRSAGFKRNLQILANVDAVAAFWNKQSKGTQHTIKNAVEMRIPTVVFGPDGNILFQFDEDDAALLAAEDMKKWSIPKEVRH